MEPIVWISRLLGGFLVIAVVFETQQSNAMVVSVVDKVYDSTKFTDCIATSNNYVQMNYTS